KFAEWGVTDFEMAPQYVSSTDGSFLDSVIQNGYASPSQKSSVFVFMESFLK
ncbi:hypothetical protein LGW71_05230, partial [Streptococcus mutans]|nr:hypothetical protein [Streptococcus mutans]